jgi:CubicO group peptidase (beta-lactamase class C family)
MQMTIRLQTHFLILLVVSFLTTVAFAGPDAEKYGSKANYPLAHNYWLGERDEYAVAEYSGERLKSKHNFYSGNNELSWVRRSSQEPRALLNAEVSWGLLRNPDRWIKKNNVLAVAIYKEGKLIHETYQYGRTSTHLFNSQSMTKTLTAMAIGLGVHEGKIDIDKPSQIYLPFLTGTPLGKVTVRNHLKMASGSNFRWDEQGDAKKYFLQKFAPPCGSTSQVRLDFCGVDVRNLWAQAETIHTQGERFNYDPMSSDILSAIVSAVYDQPLSKFFQNRIWKKLDTESDAFWNFMWATPTEPKLTSGANYFHATLRDWIRLSKVFIEHDSQDVIPAKWLQQMVNDKVSTTTWHISQPNMVAYGYQTWIAKKYFAMEGYRGQEILIDPKSQTVMVVFALTGGWKKDGHLFYEWLIDQKLAELEKK